MSKYIAIDIGHGTDTSGKGVQNGSVYYREHAFNSSVGLELDKLLSYNGFRTLMYQQPNSKEVKLSTRINYYNKQGVDLVVSIHADANSNKGAKGRYAFYWHTSANAKKLAGLYAEEVKALGYSLRGNGTEISKPNSWTNLAIPRDNKAVAILTENGFMTNDDDFKLIFKSEKYVQDIAKAHAKAICRYFGLTYREYGQKATTTTATKTTTVQPTTNTTHTVVKGDTLWGISQKYITTVANIKALNPSIKNDTISIGDKLVVKGTATSATATATVKATTTITGSAIRPYPGKPLVLGSKGRDVEALQRALGFKGSAIDGSFGTNTQTAVKNYQQRKKLKVTGYVDLVTWNTIF